MKGKQRLHDLDIDGNTEMDIKETVREWGLGLIGSGQKPAASYCAH
jgi:hypothetical protein